MYKLKEEDIIRVLSLSKLSIDNIDKYKKDLEDVLSNIGKVENLDISSEMMISPSDNSNVFSDYSNNKEIDVLSNAKEKVGNFIKVEDMRWVIILIYP